MPLNKSPGPDGYSVEFFKASWEIVGGDVIAAVKEFFRKGRLLKDLNNTTLALIPKHPEACRLGDYRPIYKLLQPCIQVDIQDYCQQAKADIGSLHKPKPGSLSERTESGGERSPFK